MYLKDEQSPQFSEPSRVRKGRFLWMEPSAQREYLQSISKKISSGYFYSDKVLGEIVDEIAPVINENLDNELLAA
jgi:hypothetical protein